MSAWYYTLWMTLALEVTYAVSLVVIHLQLAPENRKNTLVHVRISASRHIIDWISTLLILKACMYSFIIACCHFVGLYSTSHNHLGIAHNVGTNNLNNFNREFAVIAAAARFFQATFPCTHPYWSEDNRHLMERISSFLSYTYHSWPFWCRIHQRLTQL